MRAPDRPDNETLRLRSLYELELLNTDASEMFESAVELAAQVTGCPIALVSLVDDDRQWFAAARNMDTKETGRDVSFCGHAILDDKVMVVPDARVDARFYDNPLVTGEPDIVFYAGAPLAMPDGTTLGTVCVIDHEPRYLSERQVRAMAQLSRFVVDQLELRRSLLRLERQTEYRLSEHQRQSQRLAAIGRDLTTALNGLSAMAEKALADSPTAEREQHLNSLLESASAIGRLGQSFSDPGMTATQAGPVEVSRVDPAEMLQTVLSSYRAELEQRQIAVDLRLPGTPEMIVSDRERLRFLCFHMIGFLLSRPTQGAGLTLKVRRDPNSGVELSGYLLCSHPYRPPADEHEELELLDNLANSLGATLSTLIDEEQQLQLRIRLPLRIQPG